MTATSINSLENRFTQSELGVMNQCPKKWFLKYVQNLKLRGRFNWALAFGGALHTFLEHFYKGEDTQEFLDFENLIDISEDVYRDEKFEELLEFWKIVFPVYAREYRKFYRKYIEETFEIESVERLAVREWEGINFTGKLDISGRLKKDGMAPFILDHKTTSWVDSYTEESLKSNFQFMFYVWLQGLPECVFIADLIKKPTQRRGKKETNAGFAERVCGEIKLNPQEFFSHVQVTYTKEEIEAFEQEVLRPKLEKIKILANYDFLRDPSKIGLPIDFSFLFEEKNLNACYDYRSPCEMMEACMNKNFNLYETKTSKHEELEVE